MMVLVVVYHQGCRGLTGFPTVLVTGGVALTAIRLARFARRLLPAHPQLHAVAASVRRRWHSRRCASAHAMHK